MFAIITAGGIPQTNHPLYPYTQGKPRAMIDINGRPMIQYVLDALDESELISDVLVVGLPTVAQAQLTIKKNHQFLPDHGGLLPNATAGLEWLRENYPNQEVAVGCSADIPHVKGHMFDDLIVQCRPFDHAFYYTVATPELLNSRYPNAQRTYAKFARGVKIAGGDVFVGRIDMLGSNPQFWESMAQARKQPWRMAQAIGWGTLFKFLLRRLTLKDATTIGSKLLDRPVKTIYLTHAEMAMDGDKPHQIDLLRQTADSH